MAEAAKVEYGERVKVAFAVELAVVPPEVGADVDEVGYCGEMLLNALSGWGIGVTRVAHLTEPDSVFES